MQFNSRQGAAGIIGTLLLAVGVVVGCGDRPSAPEHTGEIESLVREEREDILFISDRSQDEFDEFMSLVQSVREAATQVGLGSNPGDLTVIWTGSEDTFASIQIKFHGQAQEHRTSSYLPKLRTLLIGPLPGDSYERRRVIVHEICHHFLTQDGISTSKPGSWIIEGAALWLERRALRAASPEHYRDTEYASKARVLLQQGLLRPMEDFVERPVSRAITARPLLTYFPHRGIARSELVTVDYLQARTLIEYLADQDSNDPNSQELIQTNAGRSGFVAALPDLIKNGATSSSLKSFMQTNSSLDQEIQRWIRN